MEVVEPIKQLLRPLARNVRERLELAQFRRGVSALRKLHGERVGVRHGVKSDAEPQRIGEMLERETNGLASFVRISLLGNYSGENYWNSFGSLYGGIGNGREKALEHSLSLDLLDFARVKRYCDVAASASPMEKAMQSLWPAVERWKQDCEFHLDWENRILSGFAQKMDAVPAGFFDALTLHCSFEHFHGNADSEFVSEVDRVLSSQGACLILPLYMDLEPKVFFDPLRTPASEVAAYDAEAMLCATFDYRQKHGRYYSPATLHARVLKHLPPRLRATLIQFSGQEALGENIYLQFGLVLHREKSIFKNKPL
jgi:hypothetical protein